MTQSHYYFNLERLKEDSQAIIAYKLTWIEKDGRWFGYDEDEVLWYEIRSTQVLEENEKPTGYGGEDWKRDRNLPVIS